MDTIEFMNAFLSGLAWGGAITFCLALYGIGYFIDSYNDFKSKSRIMLNDLRAERNKDV